jgi:hypothetical protein
MKKIILGMIFLVVAILGCTGETKIAPTLIESSFQIGDKVNYKNENFAGSGVIEKIEVNKDGTKYYIIDVGKGVEVNFLQSQINNSAPSATQS